MHAQAAPPLEVRFHRLEVNYNWARAIAIVALAGLVAVAGWMAVDRFALPDGQKVVANVTASWGSGEAARFDAVYAEDATLILANGTVVKGRPTITSLGLQMHADGYEAELAGPIVQSGRTIMAPFHLTWSRTGDEAWVTGEFELNAAGLVIRHQDYGTYGD